MRGSHLIRVADISVMLGELSVGLRLAWDSHAASQMWTHDNTKLIAATIQFSRI